VLVAAANSSDPNSSRCQQALRDNRNSELLVPAAALAEAAYLIQKRLGAHAEASLIESLTVAPWRIEGPSEADLVRAALLMRQYLDLPLGLSDALTVACAERLGEHLIASLDNHFRIVKPAHTAAFTVVP
jgi:uncharacterized protein